MAERPDPTPHVSNVHPPIPNPADAKAGKPKTAPRVSVGGKVNVVTAKGERVSAKVTKVGEGGLVDLEFVNGEDTTPTVITSSPWDGEGKKPDSWHE